MALKLCNDEPVLLDELDRWELVREVGDSIAHCQPPQVLGIHGDWGLGKTSFLHQVHFYLRGECPQQSVEQVEKAEQNSSTLSEHQRDNVRVVWFEAWRYQTEPAPVVALLHEMRSQLEWQLKAFATGKKLVSTAIRGALLSMEELTKKIGFQASKFLEAGQHWEQEHLASTLPSNTLRELLEEAINGLLHPELERKDRTHRRVVVMIDDLDRCDPEAAYRLLEGLKIYLALPNCVFVLGMNQQIVADAISKHVPVPDGDDGLRAERASSYLEKLCHNVWRLPAVRQPKDFLLHLLPNELGDNQDPGAVKQSLSQAIGEHRCLPPNPRRLKGLANLLQRLALRLPLIQSSDYEDAMAREARLMLIVAYVYQFHPDLFRLWESNPEVHGRLLDWAENVPVDASSQPFDPLDKVLKRLHHAEIIQRDESAQPPEFEYASAFPDPTDVSVFWVQRLLHEAAQVSRREAGTGTWDDFDHYLHAVTNTKQD